MTASAPHPDCQAPCCRVKVAMTPEQEQAIKSEAERSWFADCPEQAALAEFLPSGGAIKKAYVLGYATALIVRFEREVPATEPES